MRRLVEIAKNPKAWMLFHIFGIARWLILFPLGMTIWRENLMFLMYVSLDTALTGALVGFGTTLAARKADPDDPT